MMYNPTKKYSKWTSPWCGAALFLLALIVPVALYKISQGSISSYTAVDTYKGLMYSLAAWLVWSHFYKFNTIEDAFESPNTASTMIRVACALTVCFFAMALSITVGL